MTPGVPPEGAPAPAAGTDAASAEAGLEAYVEANAGRFTDEAITVALVRAGYDPEAIRTSLAAARARSGSRPAARARRAILAAYGIVFLALSAGMLLHTGTGGVFMPNSSGGIAILAVSLLVALGLSAVWLASRRAFAIVVLLVIVAVAGGSFLSAGGSGPIIAAAIALGCLGGAVLLLRWKPASGSGEAALGVLLAIPVLLLLVVAGICVASGLPIPGGA